MRGSQDSNTSLFSEFSPRTRWLEVRLRVDNETAEAVNEVFSRLGVGGAVWEQFPLEGADEIPEEVAGSFQNCWIKAYLPVRTVAEELTQRRRIEEALWHLSQIRPIGEPEFKLLADEDWAEAWKATYRPIMLGQRLVIKPSWCEWQAKEGQIIIELDPGQAFGTGLHPSTQLCLIGLEKWLKPRQQVLDLGTGSGILAIAAAKLGAKDVLAVDIDSLAIEVAKENVRANRVDSIVQLVRGTLPPQDEADSLVVERAYQIAPAGFDLILVNILADVIANMLARGLSDWLAPAGIMLASGIIRERQLVVLEAMTIAGLEMIEQTEQGDWVALVARKPL